MKIKSISKAVLLFALLTSTSFAAGKNVNVEFRKGHSSAQYSGEIKGYDYDRVGGGITPAVLSHHRTCGSAYGGSC